MKQYRPTKFNWWEAARGTMPRVFYGGGKSQQSTSQVSIPPEVLAQYQNVNSIANQVAQTPFQQYSQDPNAFVAPLTTTQQAGILGTNQYASEAQPFYQQAAKTNTPSGVMSYYNPEASQVGALMQQQFQQAQSGQLGNAIQNGAFGGDRAAVTAANLQQQQGLAYGNAMAGIYQQAVGNSQNAANLEANIGSGAQSAGLAGAQAQLTAGQAQQQTEQAGLTALYNQNLQQQSYPFQTTQFLANIAEGTGALSGSTTTTNQPAPYFSDERLKDDIEPIGKTFDGLDIIKFKYKGSKQPHIGLSAQDVERKHPDAVGLAGGYKTVDYDGATRDAAEKGRHNHAGGLVVPLPFRRQDGSVIPERRTYDAGGYAGLSPNSAWSAGFVLDPSYLQAQEAAYGNAPWGNAGPVTGSAPYGGKARVPPSMGGVHASLAVAKPPAEHNSSGLQQLSSGLGQLEKLGGQGKGLFNSVKGYIPGLAPSTTTTTQPAPAMGATSAPSGNNNAAPAPPPPSNDASSGQMAGLAPTDVADIGSPDLSYLDFGDALTAKRGGHIRHGLDAGGTPSYSQPTDSGQDDQSDTGDIPYDSGTGAGGLDIPDDKSNNKLAVAQPPSSSGGGGGFNPLGLIGPVLGLFGFSDERLKEDIEPIGETYDHQQIFKYRYKGSPEKHIGLMAQDVEKSHPGAVGLAAGYKTVDYDKATKKAASIGHRKAKGGRVGLAGGGLPANDAVVSDVNGDPTNDLGGDYSKWLGSQGLAPSRPVDPDYVNQGHRSLAQALGMSGYEDTANQSPPSAPVAAYNDNSGGLGHNIVLHKAAPKQGLNPDAPAPDAEPVQMNVPTVPPGDFGTIPEGMRRPTTNTTVQPMAQTPGAADAARVGRGFFGGNQDWLVPLMHGLGTMASSNSRYLGSAILQGLGGAADSYENVQNEMMNRGLTGAGIQQGLAHAGETQANTGLSQAETGKIQTEALGHILQNEHTRQALANGDVFTDGSGNTIVRMPNGQNMYWGDWAAKGFPPTLHQVHTTAGNPAASQEGTNPIPTAPGSPAAARPAANYSYLGSAGLSSAANDFRILSRIPPNSPGYANMMDISHKTEEALQSKYSSAVTSGASLNQLSDELMHSPPTGLLASGALNELGQDVVNRYNSVVNALGADPKYLMSPQDLGTEQAVKKLTAMAQFARTQGADQHSMAALEIAGLATPGNYTTKDGQAKILAGLYALNQQDIDPYNYLQEYKRQVQATSPRPDWYLAQNAMQNFNRDHNATEYQHIRQGMQDILSGKYDVGQKVPIYERMLNGTLPPAAQKMLDRKYGVHNFGRIMRNE